MSLYRWETVYFPPLSLSSPVPFSPFSPYFDTFAYKGCVNTKYRQSIKAIGSCVVMETRNSATAGKQRVSCPHRRGLGPPGLSPPPPSPLATPMYMVESETRNKRTSSVLSTKRTLRWIAHSRSFKVILIGAGRHPERCVVVMSN